MVSVWADLMEGIQGSAMPDYQIFAYFKWKFASMHSKGRLHSRITLQFTLHFFSLFFFFSYEFNLRSVYPLN